MCIRFFFTNCFSTFFAPIVFQYPIHMERQSRNNSLIEFIINLLLYISAGSIGSLLFKSLNCILGYWILKRWFFKGRSPTQPSRKPITVGENQKSFIDDVFEVCIIHQVDQHVAIEPFFGRRRRISFETSLCQYLCLCAPNTSE